MSFASRLAAAGLAALAFSSGPARAGTCPRIMFVLDRSGSMAEDPNGKPVVKGSKWELAQAALIKVVTMYGDKVSFGLEMFTSGAVDDQACYDDTQIDVEPPTSFSNYTAAKTQIIKKVMNAMPDSGTNTGEAIRRAAEDTALHDKTRGDYIVLITDGDPNCNGGDQVTPDYTVSQIKAAAASGGKNPPIHTFVIGFDGSAGVNPANLNLMAEAGKEPIPGCAANKASPCYYSASNAQKFNDAISKIVNQVVGGEFGTAMCDDSCYSVGCPNGYVCTTDEQNLSPHCVPDPCAGVRGTCQPDQFCRQGQCVAVCVNQCPSGERCVDGACVPDLCAGMTCDPGQACDPGAGVCVQNPCGGAKCPSETVCNLASGKCEADPCHLISCPQGSVCVGGGNCEGTTPAPMDPNAGGAGTGGRHSQVGCAVSMRRDGGLGALAAAVLLGLLLWVRRRDA